MLTLFLELVEIPRLHSGHSWLITPSESICHFRFGLLCSCGGAGTSWAPGDIRVSLRPNWCQVWTEGKSAQEWIDTDEYRRRMFARWPWRRGVSHQSRHASELSTKRREHRKARSERKWDSKYRVRRFWCNFLRQLNAIWQEKRWVSKRQGFSVTFQRSFCTITMLPSLAHASHNLFLSRAARVHLSHFSEPHLGRPRIVWQWKRGERSAYCIWMRTGACAFSCLN